MEVPEAMRKSSHRYLVDMPTAGILHNGMIGMSVHFYEMSGVLMSLEAGAFNRLTFGLSYGGTNIIGTGPVDWNKVSRREHSLSTSR